MAANVTTLVQIAPGVSEFYFRTMLKRLLPVLLFDRWAQPKPLPEHSGTTVKFRRYTALATNQVPLTEGVTPTAKQLAKTDLTALPEQYGDYVIVTDKCDIQNVERVLVEAAELLGEQAGQSIDLVYRDVFVAGTQATYSGSATTRATVSAIISAAMLDTSIRKLHKNNAREVTEQINASEKVGTTPIAPCFVCVIHPDVEFDLIKIPGFIPVREYPAQQGLLHPFAEVGSYRNLRFVRSTQTSIKTGAGAASTAVKNTSGNADVYLNLVFARDAVGTVPLGKKSTEHIVKPFGSGGTGDPMNQRATSAWKAFTTGIILQDLALDRLECAASL